ncbi:MBL fold metallo-hydrolase, partial [Pandoraea pneumonica]
EVAFWTSPDFSHTVMPAPVPPVLRTTATAFYNAYREQLQTFEHSREVAPGVTVRITGGHTPGHSVVDLVSGDERLTFAGDAMFPVGFDHP